MSSSSVKSGRPRSRANGIRFLQAAAQACPHGLMVEKGGKVVYCNPAYARLLGLRTPSRVLGMAVTELPVPQSPESRKKGAEDGPTAGEPDSAPSVENRRFEFHRRNTPMAVHVVRDLSDAGQRTQLETQLRNSQGLESLGRVVGGVAHDFNNLLTAISLYSDLLLQELNGAHPASRRRAGEIRAAAQQGISLVHQLLALARHRPAAAREVALNQLVTDMADMLQRLLGREVQLHTICGEPLPTVRVDPGQMQQVIFNLVINGRDAISGKGRIRVETGNRRIGAQQAHKLGVAAGRYVALTVSDTGCGMDAATRARLFEPFFTTKPGKGTGLGMVTVQNAVKGSGGSLLIDSAPGRGTRVTVLLPAAGEAAARPAHTQPKVRQLTGKTILLVEDDPRLRGSVAKWLMDAGYHVLQATDGEHALEIARRQATPIHVLLSNLVVPGVSGRKLSRLLHELHPEARALFISGFPEARQFLDSGTEVLPKPFTRVMLSRKVRELLDSSPPALAGAHG